MAKSLANFVVGIGADTSGFKDGMKEVNSGMNTIRSSALLAGTALTTALTAVTGIAFGTANEINDLSLQMQFTDATVQRAYNFGNAVQRMGGDAQTARDEFVQLQKTVDGLTVGDNWDKLGIEMGKFDIVIDFNPKTDDLLTFQNRLADTISVATSKQKLQIQDVFGFSDATMRLLEKGSLGVELELQASMDRTGDIEKMVESSRDLVNEWGILKEHATGFKNVIAEETIPALTEAVKLASSGLTNAKVAQQQGEGVIDSLRFGFMVTGFQKLDELFGGNEESKPDNTEPPQQTEPSRPTSAGFLMPQIMIERDAPVMMQNPQSSVTTSQQQVRQPIEITLNNTTSVELDGRKIGESVETYQQEQNFITLESFKTTTVA